MTIELNSSITKLTAESNKAIYVDQITGNDEDNNGSLLAPVATIERALKKAALLQVLEPDQTIQIFLALGTYEDIILEDINLRSIEIHAVGNAGFSGILGPSGALKVRVNNLTSTTNNGNLKFLKFEGIEFTGALNLSADSDGDANVFGAGYISFDNCRFTGPSITTLGVSKIHYKNCQIRSDQYYTNARLVQLSNTQSAYNDISLTVDELLNKPIWFDSAILRIRDSSSGGITTSRLNGATNNIQVELHGSGRSAGVHTICEGASLNLQPGTYIWAMGDSTIGPNTTVWLVGGWWMIDNWTIDPTSTFYICETGFGESIQNNTIHVNLNTGNDVFNGSEKYPYATIGAAISKIQEMQSIDPTQLVELFISEGTYSESITLESVDLTKLKITGTNVTVDSLVSETSNENLIYLKVEGITFNNASSLVCDVDGVGSLLCSEDSIFTSCHFLSSLLIQTAKRTKFYNTRIEGELAAFNVGEVYFDHSSWFNCLFTLKFDTTLNQPENVSGTGAYGYDTYLFGGLKTINNGGAYCVFTAWSGVTINSWSSTTVTEIGTDSQLQMYPGSVHKKTQTDNILNGSLSLHKGSSIEDLLGHDPNWVLNGTVYKNFSKDYDEDADNRILYINQIYGNDVFQTGTKDHPLETVSAATTIAAGLQAYWVGWGTTESQLVQIAIASGSYAEDLVIEDSSLHRLEIIASDDTGSVSGDGDGKNMVVLRGLTSTKDNENLIYLKVKGIEFTESVDLSCDIDGSFNLFGSELIVFENCIFSGPLVTLSALDNIKFIDCDFAANTVVTNISSMELDSSKTDGLSILIDGTENQSAGFTASTINLSNSSLGSISSSRSGGAYQDTQINCLPGAVVSGVHTIGDGTSMQAFPGSCLQAQPGSELESGSCLDFLSSTHLENWTVDPSAVLGFDEIITDLLRMEETITPAGVDNFGSLYPKDDDNLYFQDGSGIEHQVALAKIVTINISDIDTGTSVIDSFAQTDADAAHWIYSVKKGSNTRSGIINACWNETGPAISKKISSTGDIGDTSDLVFNIVITSGVVELQAVSISDNWIVKITRTLI